MYKIIKTDTAILKKWQKFFIFIKGRQTGRHLTYTYTGT